MQNEYVHEVFLEIQDDPALKNWREDSGLLIRTSTVGAVSSADELARIWTPRYFRLFVGHKADYKTEAGQLKDALERFGVSCFVAHEDIEPTKEWQTEIEKALFSMDALLALMTDGFSNSNWTDQEIGVAIGRQVPIIPLRLGMDPYGFIGKYQALSGADKTAAVLAGDVYDLLWAKPVSKERIIASLVARFENAGSFREANDLMSYLERIHDAPPGLVERLEAAQQQNTQVAGAYAVRDRLPRLLRRLRGSAV